METVTGFGSFRLLAILGDGVVLGVVRLGSSSSVVLEGVSGGSSSSARTVENKTVKRRDNLNTLMLPNSA